MAQDTTPPQVAATATQTTNDLGDSVTLLGTFGSQSDPQALLKLRGGKTATVSRGDRVNGQTVVAIEDGRVALARNGTAHWIDMPAPNS
ncbi:MAG: amidophosphoribosyltransferase [Marivita sp.]|uniref:amidophosphoribosyltransferase n=1 Tax=Marivita sp. TaxID=2003365 RepID=UPI0025C09BA5|nr:amidophosphoribosyltransferase [Marivita sp.]MCI5111032.1 amidophosphoribosyltransferase [Marivita sp.]